MLEECVISAAAKLEELLRACERMELHGASELEWRLLAERVSAPLRQALTGMLHGLPALRQRTSTSGDYAATHEFMETGCVALAELLLLQRRIDSNLVEARARARALSEAAATSDVRRVGNHR
ncbi:MAG TPA: hypothetical protein VK427_13710 [Kofleriaceae bacterium]|nr:hypothetical protein [Kofleriaceae bacterium]